MSEQFYYLGVMALCQAMIDLQSGTGQLSRKSLLYHAQSLATLTTRLGEPKSYEDDAVLLTVITLATWEVSRAKTRVARTLTNRTLANVSKLASLQRASSRSPKTCGTAWWTG